LLAYVLLLAAYNPLLQAPLSAIAGRSLVNVAEIMMLMRSELDNGKAIDKLHSHKHSHILTVAEVA
jgi:hypothetical protein